MFCLNRMPCSYSIDEDKRVVFNTSSGVVTDNDLVTNAILLRSDKNFQGNFRCLSDYTRVTALQTTAATLTTLAANQPFSPESRRAFLVTAGWIGSSVEFYRTTTTGQVRVFTDRAEALAWLNEGVPPEKHIT